MTKHNIDLLEGRAEEKTPDKFLGWVAYTDDECSDWAGHCKTPEDAIAEWLSEKLEDWLDAVAEGVDFPNEITVARAVTPDHLMSGQADTVLDQLTNCGEMPDGCEWPPDGYTRAGPGKRVPTPEWERFDRRVTLALRDFLEETTGKRGPNWWQADDSQVWTRHPDGTYKPEPKKPTPSGGAT